MNKSWGPLLAIGLVGLGVWFLLRLSGSRPAASAPIVYRPRRVDTPQLEEQPVAHAAGSTYSNLEEWEIVRNEKGRIQSIRIHRNAHVT